MPADRGFVEHVMEQLRTVEGVTGRSMFGGYGIFHDSQMFGLVSADSALYFKVDDVSRAAYEEAGSEAFRPPVPAGRAPMSMRYFEVPAAVLDEPATLVEWARTAIEAAHATPPRKPRRPRR